MKTLVISGGSSGIGLATVQRFLDAGYFVFNLDLKKSAEHERLQFIECDVSSVVQIEEAAAKISEVDALVCNAGVHFSENILETSQQDFDRVLNINLKSCFFLTQKFLPLLVQKKNSAIVYVGSDQSLIAKKNSAVYGLTKTALTSLAKTTAIDFAAQGVRANCIAVGTIDTPLYQQAIRSYSKRSGISLDVIHQEESALQPIGRLGQAEEVANLIYFLSDEQSSFITGAVMSIDGGYTAQ